MCPTAVNATSSQSNSNSYGCGYELATAQDSTVIGGEFDISYDMGNEQKVCISTLEKEVGSDGTVSITKSLIDPYGIITDAATGKAVAGANVTLYYANTARNKANGKTPDTVVQLPEIDGFKPNDNKNPQLSDTSGAYGFMVFPTTDYYIVATKNGYNKYTSPTISVEQQLVEWNFKMNKTNVAKPVITLNGESEVTVKLNDKYTDAGAIAKDDNGVDLTSSIVTSNAVDTSKAGDYTVTYNVTDATGNKAEQVTRIVHVVDPNKISLGLSSVLNKTVTLGTEAGTLSDPKTGSIDVDNNVKSIKASDIAADENNDIVTFYGIDNTFKNKVSLADSVPLTVGKNDIYVTVAAVNNIVIKYYKITINRGEPIIISIADMKDINVANGTELSSLSFPSSINVILSDGTTTSTAVTWDKASANYDGNKAGSYIFKGTITLPAGATNPNNLGVTVKVVVEAPQSVPVVTTVTGNEQDVNTNTDKKLIQTGSMLDSSVLVSIGLLLIAMGVIIVFRRKKSSN